MKYYITNCVLPLVLCTIVSQLNVVLLALTDVFVTAESISFCLMPVNIVSH